MELPATGAEQSVLPRVTWQDAAADICATEPTLPHPRSVVSDRPMDGLPPVLHLRELCEAHLG